MSLTHALIWPLPLWSRCGWLRALHPSVAGSWPRLPACGDGSLGRPPDVLATHLHQGEAVSHPSTILALRSLLSEITIGSLRLQTLWGAGWFLPFPPPFTLTKNVSKTKGKHTHTHTKTHVSLSHQILVSWGSYHIHLLYPDVSAIKLEPPTVCEVRYLKFWCVVGTRCVFVEWLKE